MKFTALSCIPLAAGATFKRPPELPKIIHLDDPATDVMTDFNVVNPVTVKPNVPIDDALEKMKSAGVRLLLVTNDADEIIGLITSKDIMGEGPIDMVQEIRVPRSEITVAMIMTQQEAIGVLDMADVRRLQVGHIVETLQQLERQHVLVIEVDEATRAQQVYGMFSMSEISKRLGRDAGKIPEPDHEYSLAEMVHGRGQ